MAKPRTQRRSRLSIEDQSKWSEIQRSQEVKIYDSAKRWLVVRTVTTRIVSLFAILYIGYLVYSIIGIGGLGPIVTSGERQIALEVSIGWIVLYVFFRIAWATMMYRPRIWRVSRKGGSSTTPFFDRDNS